MPEPLFADRAEAGRLLAAKIAALKLERPVVYALPRGGAPVAFEIAKAIGAPLDLVLVRKIGVPSQPELAVGSIVDGERPDIIVNQNIVAAAGVSEAAFKAIAARELAEIERRRVLYGAHRQPVRAEGRSVVLVDDGVATGASMRAAITAMRRRRPRLLIAAAPVAAPDTARDLACAADRFICLAAPSAFGGVGAFYRDFHQLEDAEVLKVLADADALGLGAEQAH